MLAILVGLVLIGGIRRIAAVAGALVPVMAIGYIGAGLVVIALNIDAVPEAFRLIFTHAFTPIAATGGFAGAAVWAAIRFGVARGIFSNEAGLGSAPIAHAAAECKGPVSQGLVAMLGTFIDTILVCSFTATGDPDHRRLDQRGDRRGVDLACLRDGAAGRRQRDHLDRARGVRLHHAARLELLLRALLAVSSSASRSIIPFRIVWSLAPIVGATVKLSFIWLLADVLNALMAIPNLIALALLSPVVFAASREFFKTRGKSEHNPF